MYCSQFITRYGAGIVYAADHGVVKVEIPDLSCNQTTAPVTLPEFESSETTVQVAHMLERYFQGECTDFSSIPVLFDAITPFRRTVLKVIRTLGFGEICSYGEVAHMCGSPHAARAVGGALASNPVPIIIPCHRVVASDGRLTGFSAPGGESTKKALLQMEGVEFKGVLAIRHHAVIHRTSHQ